MIRGFKVGDVSRSQSARPAPTCFVLDVSQGRQNSRILSHRKLFKIVEHLFRRCQLPESQNPAWRGNQRPSQAKDSRGQMVKRACISPFYLAGNRIIWVGLVVNPPRAVIPTNPVQFPPGNSPREFPAGIPPGNFPLDLDRIYKL